MTDGMDRMWTSACGKQIVQDGMKKWPSDVEWVRADYALALVAEAYEVAVAVCEDAKPAYDGHRDPDRAERENAACDVLSDVADEIRAKTPSDALAAREADRKRVRDEALRKAIKNLWVFAPSLEDGPEHDVGYYHGYLTAIHRIRDITEGDQTDGRY